MVLRFDGPLHFVNAARFREAVNWARTAQPDVRVVLVSAAGINAIDATGLDEALMGVLFTAVATSLPELVTTLAAVRRGALTLAVAGIIGGNAFDTLFAAFSDVAYTEGSIYHAVSSNVVLWTALGAVMTAVLMLGLIRREPRGPGGIGFESVGLLGLYGLGVLTVVLG